MVRTVADGKKAVGSKAPRKQLGGAGGSRSGSVYAGAGSPASNNANFGGFNHAKMWPTPSWQKGIGNFFKKCDKPASEDDGGSSSSSSCQSPDTERMDDVIVTSVTSSGSSSSSGGDGGSSGALNPRVYSDDEDKENIDPASSPELKETRSEFGSPSPKIRRKANGKQKAAPSKRKKRAVLQEDSDYETED